MTSKTWRAVHRYCGLGLAAFTIFYAVTGILLNHRQSFAYFVAKEKTIAGMEQLDTGMLRQLLRECKIRIGRSDDPRVIRIPDAETIEFLYGSHGKTIYRLKPALGLMEKIEKHPEQPFFWLNRLHKAGKVSLFWLVSADLFCLLVIVMTISGLVIIRYRRSDYLLLAGGVLFFILGMMLA